LSRDTDLSWQKGAICALPENEKIRDYFFSTEPTEKYQAKNLCFLCPVRKDCLKWALEHRQIWGIWGGKDEGEIRRALSVSWNGQESRRQRYPQCPYCTARPSKLETVVADVPGGGRWATMRLVHCTACDFMWRSRTSANAVDAYHVERLEKLARQEKVKAKKKERLERKRQKQDLRAAARQKGSTQSPARRKKSPSQTDQGDSKQ
jgi:WhiB family redox-sensing transcriptional regulator